MAAVSKEMVTVERDIILEPKNFHLLATGAILLLNITSLKNGMLYVTQPAANLNRKAFRYAMTAVALAPNDARSHAALGAAYGALNNPQDAVAELDKALSLAPTDIDVNQLASRFYANVLFDAKRSRECYSRLVKAYPNSPYFWRRLGNARESESDMKGAIQAYSLALQKDPNYLAALQDRYGLYHHLRQWDNGIKDATKMIELKTNEYMNREYCYEQAKQYDKALADVNTAIVLENRALTPTAKSMNLKPKLQKIDAFVPEFQKLDKEYRNYFLVRARLYGYLGKYDAGIAELKPLLQSDPKYEKGLDCRQTIYRKANRYRDALVDLNKLLLSAPSVERYKARADTYLHLGEKEKALADIERAREQGTLIVR